MLKHASQISIDRIVLRRDNHFGVRCKPIGNSIELLEFGRSPEIHRSKASAVLSLNIELTIQKLLGVVFADQRANGGKSIGSICLVGWLTLVFTHRMILDICIEQLGYANAQNFSFEMCSTKSVFEMSQKRSQNISCHVTRTSFNAIHFSSLLANGPIIPGHLVNLSLVQSRRYIFIYVLV